MPLRPETPTRVPAPTGGDAVPRGVPERVARPDPASDAEAARELRLRTARREVTERRRITLRLRHALAGGGLVLHYQPLVTLKTGMIRGAEALPRLQHRRRGLIPPNHFMPVAERSDIIIDMGGWMLRAACEEATTWPGDIVVAMPLTVRHLQSGRMIRQLLEALSQTQLEPARIEIELTETMLINDQEDLVFSLKALQSIGVRLALTNFGTGYASLSALKRLPLATLRLDRSLVQNLSEGQAGPAIVHAAIEAGHALGCRVLADGIETEAQYDLLRQLGCDDGQGNYFGAAVPATDLAAMLGR
jgi:EAL domain-containing protein (putative c-di-GMP-specific phosphodiesterase class I)